MLDLLASQRPLFFLNYKPLRLLLKLQPVYLQSYQLITAPYSRTPRTIKTCLANNSLALILVSLSSEFDVKENRPSSLYIDVLQEICLSCIRCNDRIISATDFIFQKKQTIISIIIYEEVCAWTTYIRETNRKNSRDYTRDIAQRCFIIPSAKKIPFKVVFTLRTIKNIAI